MPTVALPPPDPRHQWPHPAWHAIMKMANAVAANDRVRQRVYSQRLLAGDRIWFCEPTKRKAPR